MHRRLVLLFLLLGWSSASTAILWACSSDDQSAPPEPDAGNPNRQPFDSGNDVKGDAPSDGPTGPTYKARAAIAMTSLTGAGTPTGTLDLVQSGDNIHVSLMMAGATAGMHGVHIHDGTSCADNNSGVDGALVPAGAAGPHWNPEDAGHGFPTSTSHHPGDFGNITIAGDGTGTLMLDVPVSGMNGFDVQADGGNLSALGHAVIFHQGADDGTGTTGDAGSRAGCGIIQPL